MSNISYDIGDRPLVPMFEIAANPTIRLDEVKSRRFFIIDRAQVKAKEEIRRQEEELETLIKARRVINSIFEVDLNE